MFKTIHGDITKLNTDAIVNAANERLAAGGGVCGAIFRAAGYAELQKVCDDIGHCATGQAVITPAFNLSSKYIIHTPGPVWSGSAEDRKLLASCYTTSMQLALDKGCKSIAFPLISSGIFGCPKDIALDVATKAMESFTTVHKKIDVYLVLHG